MNYLAIDTSTDYLSIALLKDNILYTREDNGFKTHNQNIFKFIDSILKEASLTLKDIQKLVCGVGPGSFTGLRVGLSAFKGFAYALDIPIALFDSIEAVALEAILKDKLQKAIVVLDGKQKDFFYADYSLENNKLIRNSEIKLLANQDFEGIFKGKTVYGYLQTAPLANKVDFKNNFFPKAEYLIKLAQMDPNNTSENLLFEPNYYKNFKINKPKKIISYI